MLFWKRYIDDTLTIVKECSNNHTSTIKFLPSIMQFTFEMESSERIPLLDMVIIQGKSSIEATVYRKSTDTGIFLTGSHLYPTYGNQGC